MVKKKTSSSPPAVATSGSKTPRPKATKLSKLETMLRRPGGATIAQLCKALVWQAHSVRGAMAGALKKKGCTITSEVGPEEVRIYRIP
jgi:hypothetical protein